MSLLRNFRGCCLPSADSPNRLISDDNLAPVFDARLKSVKLYLQDIVSVAGFALLQLLANADNRI